MYNFAPRVGRPKRGAFYGVLDLKTRTSRGLWGKKIWEIYRSEICF